MAEEKVQLAEDKVAKAEDKVEEAKAELAIAKAEWEDPAKGRSISASDNYYWLALHRAGSGLDGARSELEIWQTHLKACVATLDSIAGDRPKAGRTTFMSCF